MQTAKSKDRVTNIETISNVTNGAEETISAEFPYRVNLMIQGISDFLFHRWNDDAVAAKAAAAKGSKAKKSDDVESYVYRHPSTKNLAIPGEYLRSSIIGAAKFRQDPRSPRKSAQDLFKAGVLSLTNMADTGNKQWDYLDRRRALVQRQGITRIRPALTSGWTVEFDLMVNVPEYINPDLLREVVDLAGRLVGIGDFRPTFGRFVVASWSVNV
jgi:hypothetical protein